MAFDDIDHKAWLYPKVFLEIIFMRIISQLSHIYSNKEMYHFIKDII